MNRVKKMLLCMCCLIQVEVCMKVNTENEKKTLCTLKKASQIFIVIMFSVTQTTVRNISASLSRSLYHYPISITLMTVLFSWVTHVPVILCPPWGTFSVNSVSSSLNKVLCTNWQTGSVLSLPLTGRINPNTGGLGTCEHKSDGRNTHV